MAVNLATRLRALESSGRYAVREDTEFERAQRRHEEGLAADPEFIANCADRHTWYAALGVDPDDWRACLDAHDANPELFGLAQVARQRYWVLREGP